MWSWFYIRLPRLMMLNWLMCDAQRRVNGLGAVGLENATAIADEGLGAAVLAQGRIEDGEEGAQVLPPGEGAGQDGTAVVLQDADAVDRVPINLVHIDVAQVHRPVLVPVARRKRHFLRCLRQLLRA